MQRVTIQPRKTHFWRFQQVDDQHLATIEAIYYFYKEYEQAYQKETGSYDNLLFYYKFFYELVQSNYTSKKAIKFTERHKQKDYIKY
jgi:hypothetical protein